MSNAIIREQDQSKCGESSTEPPLETPLHLHEVSVERSPPLNVGEGSEERLSTRPSVARKYWS